jgi:hypothetical protein
VNEFLDVMLSFPTVIFTFLLGIALIYWLLVILGALDLDLGDPGGFLHGADHALEGAHGALDGAGEAAHGGLDHHGSADAFSILGILGLHGVPLTMVLSVIVLVGWAVSGIATTLLRGNLPSDWWTGALQWAVVAGIGTSALCAGMLTAAVVLRPLRTVFKTEPGRRRHSLVGCTGILATQRVDAKFGQAEVQAEDDFLLIEVRCEEENELKKGSRVLIFDYDATQEVFHVIAHRND